MKILVSTLSRKKPGLNPKISLFKYLSGLKNIGTVGKSIPNLFVSFTQIEKLGINPGSEYETPLGICSYPAQYLLDEEYFHNLFAGKSPFANVFQVKGNILNAQKFNVLDFKHYIAKLKAYYPVGLGLKEDTKRWTDAETGFDLIVERSSEAALFNNYIGRFWYISQQVASMIYLDRAGYLGNSKECVVWNSVLRSIGVDGVYDDGMGVIHENEPHQAIFFSKSCIIHNVLLDNKWSEFSIDEGQDKASDFKLLHAAIKEKDLTTVLSIIKGKIKLLKYIDGSTDFGNKVLLEFFEKCGFIGEAMFKSVRTKKHW